jgi:hypothetical protein
MVPSHQHMSVPDSIAMAGLKKLMYTPWVLALRKTVIIGKEKIADPDKRRLFFLGQAWAIKLSAPFPHFSLASREYLITQPA